MLATELQDTGCRLFNFNYGGFEFNKKFKMENNINYIKP